MSKTLIVNPKYFSIDHSINPWMNKEASFSHSKAVSQWKKLQKKLIELSLDVLVYTPEMNLPDIVFAANAGMNKANIFIPSNFKDPIRKKENAIYTKYFKIGGYKINKLPRNIIWEGQACSYIYRNKLLHSIGARSDKKAGKNISKIFNINKTNIINIDLIDPFFYHLDVALTILNNDLLMYCPLAFKDNINQWLENNSKYTIKVSYQDALLFACNSFVYKNNIIINSQISSILINQLQKYGFNVYTINISEFIKSGGGIKCLIYQF